MKDKKTLVIEHDGAITVSDFLPLALNDYPLHKIVAEALGLKETDYKTIPAEVKITITLKAGKPTVAWGRDNRC